MPRTPLDPASEEKLKWLYPDIAARIRRVYEDVYQATSLSMRPAETLRSFERQAALYAQGRTAPGKKVTNSKPGYSFHAYGLAVDSCFMGSDPYLEKMEEARAQEAWATLGKFATAHGLTWGGNFRTIKDSPHCELTYGLKICECLEMYEHGGVRGVWEWLDAHRGSNSKNDWPLELKNQGS